MSRPVGYIFALVFMILVIMCETQIEKPKIEEPPPGSFGRYYKQVTK
jgi:hypothetical protein